MLYFLLVEMYLSLIFNKLGAKKYFLRLICYLEVQPQLFLAEEQVDGCSMQVPVLAYLVFEIALVGILDPLRQVAEEDERGDIGTLEHCDVLDFDIFALDRRRREGRDVGLQRVVQLRRRDGRAAVVVHLDGGLQHLVDALLGEC